MRRTTSRAKRIGIAGLVAFMVGGVLLGTAVVASASGSNGETNCVNSACSITVSPNSGLANEAPISVIGSDFSPGANGGFAECNLTPGEPTIAIPNNKPLKFKDFGSLPVGCFSPGKAFATVSKAGTLSSGFGVVLGVVGPPTVGTDSTGGSAQTDAQNYPCPPTQAQVAAGSSCAIVWQDTVTGKPVVNENAFADISFNIPFTTTTTTTSSTTTTTAPCNAVDGQISAPSGTGTKGAGTATVDVPGGAAPTGATSTATCVVGNMVVQVAGSGFSVGKGGLASILECNSDAGQPTISFANTNIPVSCSDVKAHLVTLSTNSMASQSFSIIQGTTGPPVPGTDSTGGDAATDAAKYPCPPTKAQVAAGDICVIAVGTSGTGAGDQLPVPISFNQNVINACPTCNLPPPSPASNPGGSGTKTAKPGSTKTSGGSLAFTGVGPGLWWLTLLGALLMVLGGTALAVVEGPRRLLRLALAPSRRQRDETS
jgi:hypothetical protein